MVQSKVPVSAAAALLCVLGAVLLGGCSSTPLPDDEFFRLNVALPAEHDTKALPGTLAVGRLQAEGLSSSRAIVYSDAAQPLLLRQYHYHFWVETPPRLIGQELVAYLRAAGVAERVTAAEAGTSPDYLVEGRVTRFEHVRSKTGAAAAISIELSLRKVSAGEPVMAKEYTRSVAVDGPGMHAVASAFNRALGEIFAQFVADIQT